MEQCYKIMLCCGAGMSSGFLASNARKAAKRKNMAIQIEARSYSEVADYISSIDVLMLGPHLVNEKESFERLAKPNHVPVVVIPHGIYSSLDGDKLLELSIKTIEENKKQ